MSQSSRTPTASKSNPRTPSSTKNKAPPATTGNAEHIRDTLARNGMHCDNDEAFIRWPEFKEHITQIIGNVPRSVMADTSVEKVLAAVKKNYTKNEKTIFRNVQPLVIKLARSVADQEDKVDGIEIIKKEFAEDGLHVIEDCNFTKRLLPLEDSVANDKTIGLTDPKPDLIYGIEKPMYPSTAESRVSQQILAYLNVAPGMRYPFYIEEHKSVEEGIIKAVHQAMRDGATLVNARRKLNNVLKPKDWVQPLGPDIDSFVFSCAWTPDISQIAVNWYEQTPDGGIFHMHRIGDLYRMTNKDDIKQMRYAVHNILDWGLLNFRVKAHQVWEEVVKHSQSNTSANEKE